MPLVEHLARHGHRRRVRRATARDVAPRRRGDDGLGGGVRRRTWRRQASDRSAPRRPGSRPGSRERRASPRRSRARASAPARPTPPTRRSSQRNRRCRAGRSSPTGSSLVGAGFGEQPVDQREHLLASGRETSAVRVVGDLAREIRGARARGGSRARRGACRRAGVRWSWCNPAPARRGRARAHCKRSRSGCDPRRTPDQPHRRRLNGRVRCESRTAVLGVRLLARLLGRARPWQR